MTDIGTPKGKLLFPNGTRGFEMDTLHSALPKPMSNPVQWPLGSCTQLCSLLHPPSQLELPWRAVAPVPAPPAPRKEQDEDATLPAAEKMHFTVISQEVTQHVIDGA